MNNITKKLKEHYFKSFELNGANSKGVDWGPDEEKLLMRYEKMFEVCPSSLKESKISILDVGCGFGGLYEFAIANGYQVSYTGIDVVETMIEFATNKYEDGSFSCEDILEIGLDRQFDFVICNGILTQKLDVSNREMDDFAHAIIKKMYQLCKIGIVFNVMTTKVNFFSNNLYYRNPAELFSWCVSDVTPYIKLNHSYPLYEYSIYLYREPQ